MNSTNPSLDINNLVKNINKFIQEFDNKKHQANKIENYYYDPIKKLVETIILKQFLFNKKSWTDNGFRVEDNNIIHKCISKIESNKIVGQGAYGKVYKIKTPCCLNNIPKNVKTIAVKIETINNEYFNIDYLKKGIKASNKAIKLGIAPKLYDIFILLSDDNIKIIKVYEYIEGTTIDKKTWKSSIEKNQFLKDLENIVRKMNKAGILHRDLHKGNVMITKKNKIYIIDFDLSRLVENSEYNQVKYFNNNYEYGNVDNNLLNFVYNNLISTGIIKF
jgi:predicted Ser/Thr protein kinase